jgi:hypothetical protein
MFVEPASTILTWGYLIDHLHLAFWLAALGIVWRFRHAVDAWADSLGVVREKTVAVERMVMETHGLATQIRTNDLAHLSEDVKEQKTELSKHLEVLQSIDKNIAVLRAVAERKKRT